MIEFKDLLALFTSSKYEEVIEKAPFCADFNAKFLHLNSLICLKRYRAALQFYEQNHKILEENNLLKSIDILLFLLLENGYPEVVTEKIMERYLDYPNVNYETYEYLEKIPSKIKDLYIKKEEEKRSETDRKNDFKNLLESQNVEDIIAFMNIEDFSIDKTYNYEAELVEFLHKNVTLNYLYKIVALELIKRENNDTFLYQKEGKYFSFKPSDLFLDYIAQETILNKCKDAIFEGEKDISILSLFSRIINKGKYLLFPNFISTEEEGRSFCAAGLTLAYRLFDYEPLENNFIKDSFLSSKDALNFYYSLLKENLLKK